MNQERNEEDDNVRALFPSDSKLYRVRITANPDDPRSVEITEDLLSRCELVRNEIAQEDGLSVWSIIAPEDLIDQALEGIAVVVPVDAEHFQTMDGRIFFVTDSEWHQLGGYAEETAICWGEEDLDDFEGCVSRIVADQMSISLQELRDSIGVENAERFPEVEARAWTDLDIFQCGEEDVREAIHSAYRDICDESED